jgi:hypothetical protein
MQIPTQRSRIPCFRPDGAIMRLDAHQCQEASNSSSLHPSRRHGNTFGHFSKFEKISTLLYRRIGKIACIRPDKRATPSGRRDP